MRCAWRTCDLHLLLTVTVLVSECLSTQVKGSNTPITNQPSVQTMDNNNHTLASVICSSVVTKNNSIPLAEVKTNQSERVDAKVVLSCPPISCKSVLLVTWIIHSDGLFCYRAYEGDKNVKVEGNCTDKRITWDSKSDCNLVLQIEPLSLTHEGYYNCQVVTPEGNFHHVHHLQVLVPPQVTLIASKNGSTVCKAVAGKPAAQISWSPEGNCETQDDQWDNGTVTVRSTCHWAESNVSTVSCAVSHLTGSKNLSITLSQGYEKVKNEIPRLVIILSIFIILSIMGSIWLLKIYACRKCKLTKREATLVGEDEMQPYASYTAKNNPLYDTVNREKTS